jgi:glycosyltransferase involved in cell wall biosynthesis
MAAADPATISVVIPIHNEAAYLRDAMIELMAELADVPADIDVVLAENGSTDDTRAIALEMSELYGGVSVLELPDPDYGGAMREGFLRSSGDWVVNFDIDYFSGPFVTKVTTLLDEADVVLASKRDPDSDDRRSPIRRLATWGFNLILRLMVGSKVSDTHGIKALRRSVVVDVAEKVASRKDLFDTELVIRAEKAGYRIVEVPVVVEEKREARSSLLSRIPRTLKGVWNIRTRLREERRAG